jgi:NAD(P)-dependent dehydrogenase (short-subunit alcohol dehydrogenase family)
LTGNLFDIKLSINRFPVLLRCEVFMDLDGKVAVVTGSGRGLGLAYAKALAASGAAVVVNDVDGDAVEAAVGAITSAGGRATGVTAPVGDTETAEALVQTAVREFGRLDVLITNAGILRDRVLWKMTDEDFDAVIRVHLRGTFTCARAAAIRMREQGEGGRIILVSSPAGQRGNFGQTNYAAAKAGIAAMARTWALELARGGITVNAVVPVAATEMTRTIPAFAPLIEESERTGKPLPAWVRRDEGLGTVDDVTGLITFLASDASKDITGQAIGVGGDRLALWAHPQEKVVAFADGGWSASSIGAAPIFGELETYGIPAPKAPEV